jgi:hypothetical protein
MGLLSKLKTPVSTPAVSNVKYEKPDPPLKYKPTKNLDKIRKMFNTAFDDLQKLIKKDGPTQQSLRMFAAAWSARTAVSYIENLDTANWKPINHQNLSIPHLAISTGERGDKLVAAINKVMKTEEIHVDRKTKESVRQVADVSTDGSVDTKHQDSVDGVQGEEHRQRRSGDRGDIQGRDGRSVRRASGNRLGQQKSTDPTRPRVRVFGAERQGHRNRKEKTDSFKKVGRKK